MRNESLMQNVLRLRQMSAPKMREVLDEVQLAIIPTGSNEQHGPNLSFEADTAIATALAERIAQRFYPQAIIVPAVPWGISYHHLSVPGTLTLRPETFIAVILDLVASLKRHGIEHFLIVNGHGGNEEALSIALTKLRAELGVKAASMGYFSLAADLIDELAQTPVYGHACEIEVSLGLYLVPEIVQRDNLVPGAVKDPLYPHLDRQEGHYLKVPLYFSQLTDNGALGDATQASAEVGKQICDLVVERTVEFLTAFLADPNPWQS